LPTEAVFFVGIALCTPISRVPIMTSNGSRTLIAYLLLGHGSLSGLGDCLLNAIFVPIIGNVDVANWIALFTLVPGLSLFASSEFINVASWPITQPSWAVALLTGGEMAVPPVVTRWSKALARCMSSSTPAYWARYGDYLLTAPLFILYTFLVVYIQSCGGDDE